MGSSQVEIVNQALVKVGATRITALSDASKQARTMNAIYAVKRDAELAAHPWTFAITRAQLPASATAPAYGWARAFPLPADYLAMVEVGENYVFYQPEAAFQLEGGQILTDEASPLNIRYIRRIDNPGLYPPLFVESFACRLAAEACEDLTQSLSKKEALWKERQQAVRDARRQNAIEQPPRKAPPGTWELSLMDQWG
jgi:hypothetical protein